MLVGFMIGSEYYIVSSDMVAWFCRMADRHVVLTGVITVIAASHELSAMFPKAGGQYVYIKEAYGKLIGFYMLEFLCCVIQTGTIAAVGGFCQIFISSRER
jgi:APA family basic amino acid/polyamine antiporter